MQAQKMGKRTYVFKRASEPLPSRPRLRPDPIQSESTPILLVATRVSSTENTDAGAEHGPEQVCLRICLHTNPFLPGPAFVLSLLQPFLLPSVEARTQAQNAGQYTFASISSCT